jgi:hypothetical protein
MLKMDGERFRESGHDVLAFMRQGGRWLAVWRATFARPAPQQVAGDWRRYSHRALCIAARRRKGGDPKMKGETTNGS